jgi:NDP-sugar pyrophosphorylase family protein
VIESFAGKSPRVHPTAFISEFAHVIGDVEIGEGSSVWPGARVTAENSSVTIGKHTNVQDNSVVRGDGDIVIGDRVVIGHWYRVPPVRSEIVCYWAPDRRSAAVWKSALTLSLRLVRKCPRT